MTTLRDKVLALMEEYYPLEYARERPTTYTLSVMALCVEECAKVAENGRFLHDQAPDARFGKDCAAAIRREGEA